MPGPLWESTRKYHHACEEHPVGAAMASGEPPIEWYTSWIATLLILHQVVDHFVPDEAKRSEELSLDLQELAPKEVWVPSPAMLFQSHFDQSLLEEEIIEGFAYVLTGAHLMGGEIMRRRLKGYPTYHLQWENRKESIAYLQTLREREELTEGAVACFETLLKCMDQICQKYSISDLQQ